MNTGTPSCSARIVIALALTFWAACSAPPAPPAPNERPVAEAGDEQIVSTQTQVTVSGADSNDPEGAILSFSWNAAVENPTPAIFPEEQVSFRFTPTIAGTYIFILTVSDGELTSQPDSVRITASSSGNRAPTADAGPDFVIGAGASVPLSALNSSDPNGDQLSYFWGVISAPDSIALDDSTAAQTRFTATTSGEYRFLLRVSDGELSSTDEVIILVRAAGNLPPVAQAGEDQQVGMGELVILDGTLSSDPDGDALELLYHWSIGLSPTGAAVTLSDSTVAQPTFIASQPGAYVFGLEVTDGSLTSLQDVVTITVLERIFNEQDGMIEVPAGAFVMGSAVGSPDEGPPHRLEMSTYWIDKFEVTVAQYQACVASGACTEAGQTAGCNSTRVDRSDHPINCINWEQASIYCLSASKHLPTEAEWERAARGDDGRTYPWGDDFPSLDRLNYNNFLGSTVEVGTYPLGISFYGLHNMSGNVQEWTADFYTADYYANSPTSDPQGPDSGTLRVVRGASWRIGIPQEVLTTTVRFAFVPGNGDSSLGFRCSAETPPVP
jgi:formylglycine-generating enzyme required for sulfatase activity